MLEFLVTAHKLNEHAERVERIGEYLLEPLPTGRRRWEGMVVGIMAKAIRLHDDALAEYNAEKAAKQKPLIFNQHRKDLVVPLTQPQIA